MTPTLLLAALLSLQTPSTTVPTSDGPVLVLALDLEGVNIEPETAKAIDRFVFAALSEVEGIEATSQQDIRTLSTLEAERQAVDCSASSCLAELAGAMGARAIVFGNVTRLGSTTSITLSLFDSQTGKMQRQNIEAHDLGEVAGALRPAVRALVVSAGLGSEAAHRGDPPSPFFVTGLVGVGVGGAVLLGGVGTTVFSEVMLDNADQPGREKESWQLYGRLGLGAAAVGAVVVGIGAVMLLLPESP